MIRLYSSSKADRFSLSAFALLAAVSVGIVALTQPIALTGILTIVVGLLILAIIHPLTALVALLVLSPLRVLVATEAAIQLPLDIGQIGLLLFFGSWAIYRHLRTSAIRFKLANLWTPLSSAFILFILVTGLSAFAATSLNAWLLEWTKWLLVFLLFTVVVNLFSSISWEWLIFALVLSGVANAFIGIYEFFGGSGALHLLINDRFFRAFGTFGQPNPFGGFMGMLIPLSIISVFGYAIRWKNTHKSLDLYLVVCDACSSLILLIAIGMSWSRGAWLGLGAALLFVTFLLPRKKMSGLILFVCIGLVSLVIWFSGLLPQSIVQRLQTSTNEFFAFEDVRGVDITPDNFAVAERLAHWHAALNMITAHPWLGVGFGNYAAAYPTYQLINWSEPLGHAHNYYLNIFAEVGIIGLLGYGKVLITIFYRSVEATIHPDSLSRLVVIGLIGAWVYIAVHSFFDNLYVNNLFFHLAIMFSVLVLIHKEAKTTVRI